MLYRTREGMEFGGADAEETVMALREISRSPGDSLAEFLAEVAIRAETQTGHAVRWHWARYDDFLADLVSAGLISRIR